MNIVLRKTLLKNQNGEAKMNEFIVWDKKSKSFIDHRKTTTAVSSTNSLCLFRNGVIYDVKIIASNEEEECKEDYDVTVHKYIGKTDINNKKIYANSSIFNFGYSVEKAKHIGYFFFCDELLSYKIKIVSKKFKGETFIYDGSIRNIKIIDTIQENKLNLIVR